MSVVLLPREFAAGVFVLGLVGCGEAGAPAGPFDDFERELLPVAEEPLEESDAGFFAGIAQDGGWTLPPALGLDAGEESKGAGSSSDAGLEGEPLPLPPAPNPFEADAVCTSDTYWPGGASVVMHPGLACISCHTTIGAGRAPAFRIAGTLYPTAHEPNDCNAENPPGAQIEITGADGRVVRLDVNEVGNFFTLAAVALPYRARVLYDGRERAMLNAQSSGDCNGCHTQEGSGGAPGRILLP